MTQLTFEQYLCERFNCIRSVLQNEITKNPTKVISYGTDYANNNFEHRVNEISDEAIEKGLDAHKESEMKYSYDMEKRQEGAKWFKEQLIKNKHNG